MSKALLLWMGGQRRWNRSEYADLQTFLMGVIDSLLSHSANGFDNRSIETRSELTLASDFGPNGVRHEAGQGSGVPVRPGTPD